MYDPVTVLRELVEDLDRLEEIPVSAASIARARQVIENHPDPWARIPKQYRGRWGFDYDEKRGFFVHCNGYGICTAEDSEVCDAICRAHNATLKTEAAALAD